MHGGYTSFIISHQNTYVVRRLPPSLFIAPPSNLAIDLRCQPEIPATFLLPSSSLRVDSSRHPVMSRTVSNSNAGAAAANTMEYLGRITRSRSRAIAKEQVSTVLEQLKGTHSQDKNLRPTTQKRTLTLEEMEDVILQICWLCRYWGLAVQYGIRLDFAISRHKYWSLVAPRPFEVVISAGKNEEFGSSGIVENERSKVLRKFCEINRERNYGISLCVGMALNELSSLQIVRKVEDAIALDANQHGTNLLLQSAPELSSLQSENVHFKQAWLAYFWRRAKNHGVRQDIAEERLQLWISRLSQSPTSFHAKEAEKGISELIGLHIELQLWGIMEETEPSEFDFML